MERKSFGSSSRKKNRLIMTENTKIKQLRTISMSPFTKPFLLHLPKYMEFALNYFLKTSCYVQIQYPFPSIFSLQFPL